VKRREFITLLGGALMASPRVVFAQSNRVPRIGILVGLAENDPEVNPRFTKFRQELERLGWSEGRNVHIDYRFAPAGAQVQERAQELIALFRAFDVVDRASRRRIAVSGFPDSSSVSI
jgi:putative ABC transport system substrate-binding protein